MSPPSNSTSSATSINTNHHHVITSSSTTTRSVPNPMMAFENEESHTIHERPTSHRHQTKQEQDTQQQQPEDMVWTSTTSPSSNSSCHNPIMASSSNSSSSSSSSPSSNSATNVNVKVEDKDTTKSNNSSSNSNGSTNKRIPHNSNASVGNNLTKNQMGNGSSQPFPLQQEQHQKQQQQQQHSSTAGPRIATTGGIRHNIVSNQQMNTSTATICSSNNTHIDTRNQNGSSDPLNVQNNSGSLPVSSNPQVLPSSSSSRTAATTITTLQTTLNVVSDTSSISTHFTQQSNASTLSGQSTSTNTNNVNNVVVRGEGNGSHQQRQQTGTTMNMTNNTSTSSGNTTPTKSNSTESNHHQQHPHKSPRLSSTAIPQRRITTSRSLKSNSTPTPSQLSLSSFNTMNSNSSKSDVVASNVQSSTTTTSTANTTVAASTSFSTTNMNDNDNDPTISNSTTNITSERRQKRLQRNRESARLSRRRRKQYLEILEERVNFLSRELDMSRLNHVLISTKKINQMRDSLLLALGKEKNKLDDEQQQQLIMKNVSLLSNQLNRTSDELNLCITFGKEYGKSLIIPTTLKFLLWLTLQNDVFYRGGRAASERLSAARIGERMLSCGHNCVSPSNGMWPLFCNEIGLSYDQEERVRTFQRELISRNETWLYRHVSYSTQHALQSLHDAILGSSELAKRRDKRVMDILTDEQKMKFLVWKMQKVKKRNGFVNKSDGGGSSSSGVGKGENDIADATTKEEDKRCSLLDKLASTLTKKLNVGSPLMKARNNSVDMDTDLFGSIGAAQNEENGNELKSNANQHQPKTTPSSCFETSATNHDSANLYILNHKLLTLTQSSLPAVVPCTTNPAQLKRLSRRPSFESLAAVNESETNSGAGKKAGKKKMSRASSSGSLKRCSSEMSCDENGLIMNMMMKKSSSGHSLSSASALAAVTPEAAQLASSNFVSAALGTVRTIIPPMKIVQHHQQQQTASTGALVNGQNQASINAIQQQQTQHKQANALHPGAPQNISNVQYQITQQLQPAQVTQSQPIFQTSTSQHKHQILMASAQQQKPASYTTFNQTGTANVFRSQSQPMDTAQDNVNFSLDTYMNGIIPNTIQSSEVMNGTTIQFGHQAASNSISAYQPPMNTQQNQGFYDSNGSNYQQPDHIHGSDPRNITVPSPLGVVDQSTYYANNQQHQNQYQQPIDASSIDNYIVDDTMLPYDVGSSFYNVSNQEADDSLFELTVEDWAIGEGAFLD